MNASDMDDGLPRLEDPDREQMDSANGRRRGIVLGLGFAIVVLIGGVMLTRDGADVVADSPQDCAIIDDADFRLSCYDKSVHREPVQPARGASAIVR